MKFQLSGHTMNLQSARSHGVSLDARELGAVSLARLGGLRSSQDEPIEIFIACNVMQLFVNVGCINVDGRV